MTGLGENYVVVDAKGEVSCLIASKRGGRIPFAEVRVDFEARRVRPVFTDGPQPVKYDNFAQAMYGVTVPIYLNAEGRHIPVGDLYLVLATDEAAFRAKLQPGVEVSKLDAVLSYLAVMRGTAPRPDPNKRLHQAIDEFAARAKL